MKESFNMPLDLKPLTQKVIQTMGYTTHDLWEVKIDEEIFGPFEEASLRDYAAENEKQFHHALAAKMDSNNWQAFHSISSLHKAHALAPGAVEERYWILEKGQKMGPFNKMAVQKKIEMGILSLSDEVSTDDGHTWCKFYQVPLFSPVAAGGAESLPVTPTEQSFDKAKEDLTEWMDTHRPSGNNAELASLVFMGTKEGTVLLNLDEIDLKSLNKNPRDGSWKSVLAMACAGLGIVGYLGNYLLTPKIPTNEDIALAQAEEKSEIILPERAAQVSQPQMPQPRPMPQTNRQSQRPTSRRMPASYAPQERSALTQTPVIHSNAYPSPEIESHVREPDPMIDPMADHDAEAASGNEGEEHSLVGRPLGSQPLQPGSINPGNRQPAESLDQSMSAPELEVPPEAPVIEEATDF